jgi:hypothetical protein
LNARREVKREKFSFVEEIISRGSFGIFFI